MFTAEFQQAEHLNSHKKATRQGGRESQWKQDGMEPSW
jgi:hypothetical protein